MVQAVAETIEDVKKIMSLASSAQVKVQKVERKKKYKVACDICGKKVKGMTMHKKLAHPVVTPAF